MITISTKYALSALLFLSEYKSNEFVSIDILSSGTEIPKPYLAKIMKTLATKDLIISKKGLGGGFKLDRAKKPLTFYEVCVALEDPIIRNSCFLERRACSESDSCSFHTKWLKMKEVVVRELKNSKIE